MPICSQYITPISVLETNNTILRQVPLQKNTQRIPPTTPPIAAPITVPVDPKNEPILPPMDAPGPNPFTNLSKPELLLVM